MVVSFDFCITYITCPLSDIASFISINDTIIIFYRYFVIQCLYDFDIGISPLVHKRAFVTVRIIYGFGKIINFFMMAAQKFWDFLWFWKLLCNTILSSFWSRIRTSFQQREHIQWRWVRYNTYEYDTISRNLEALEFKTYNILYQKWSWHLNTPYIISKPIHVSAWRIVGRFLRKLTHLIA